GSGPVALGRRGRLRLRAGDAVEARLEGRGAPAGARSRGTPSDGRRGPRGEPAWGGRRLGDGAAGCEALDRSRSFLGARSHPRPGWDMARDPDVAAHLR